MKNWIKENTVMFAVIVGLLVILGIATNEFLFVADEGGISGIEALKQSGKGFWIGLGIASILSGIGTYFLVKALKKSQGYGVGYGVLVAILLPLCIALGKGCENKTDGGVTSPNGRPEKVAIDTTRAAAEDLLPKK